MQGHLMGEELLGFIERFVVDFRARIKGCSPADLEYLEGVSMEEVCGARLPEFYSWFLRSMGEHMDVLMPKGSHIDYSARALVSAYEKGVVARVPGYFLIGVSDLVFDEPPEHEHLDLRRRSNEDAPVVNFDALSECHDSADESYPSLRECFAHQVFEYEHVQRFAHVLEGGAYAENYSKPLDAIKAFDDDLRRLGFERMPISGEYCPMYARKGGAISCWSWSSTELDAQYAVKLGFDDVREAWRTLEVLADSIQWKFLRTDHIAR